jgi:hypothetical protein
MVSSLSPKQKAKRNLDMVSVLVALGQILLMVFFVGKYIDLGHAAHRLHLSLPFYVLSHSFMSLG